MALQSSAFIHNDLVVMIDLKINYEFQTVFPALTYPSHMNCLGDY